jgi:hypothetical protein
LIILKKLWRDNKAIVRLGLNKGAEESDYRMGKTYSARLSAIFRSKLQASIRLFGYEVKKYKPGYRMKTVRYVNGFSVESIFRYFPFWQSKMEIMGHNYGGVTDYSSPRISILNTSALYKFVDFKNKSVLELGPLEGGNTILLSRLGVNRISAIEGRAENYVKCCVVKNLFDLRNATFFLDDVLNLSLEKYGSFDIAFVAGILYHVAVPQLLLEKVGEVSGTLVLATHYADERSPSAVAPERTVVGKRGNYRGKVFKEGILSDPNSGLQSESVWLYEKDLMRLCNDVGYKKLHVIARNPCPEEDFKLIYLVGKQ